MKENIISYRGIRTNNLKNIDLDIRKGTLIGIAGPSGSGKSSLAYSTIYAIAKQEWEKVSDIGAGIYDDFDVDSYKNVVPAISLKQNNYNTNPRSTIATFLRLDKYFRLLYSAVSHKSPSDFSFNNPRSACPFCNGLGEESVVEDDQLINWNKSVADSPFKLWKKPYLQKLLEKFAVSRGISLHVPLKQLTETEQNLLLHGKSDDKIAVSYRMNGRQRTHKFYFVGYLDDIDAQKKDAHHISVAKNLSSVSVSQVCHHCHGTRFSDRILSYKYRRRSIGELYMMEISELHTFLQEAVTAERDKSLHRLLENIDKVVSGLVNANLDYLHLNRSIPTLSGGELQRIRLVNILSSQIDDMMYIIDEPSARLHVSEYKSLINDIFRLRDEGNTILMIEHNPDFLSVTDRNLYIGPGSGDKGGRLLKNHQIPEFDFVHSVLHCDQFLHLRNISENNLHNVSVDIPLGSITGIYGPSGSGKSTLAKNIIKQYPHVEYVSQKPLRGSNASTIATYSGVMDAIRNVFAQANNISADVFSFNKEAGQCPVCKGKGVIDYELDFGKSKITVVCEECHGKRFSHEALSYFYKKKTIYEVLNSTIDDLLEQNFFDDAKMITHILQLLHKLGLGYLSLFRTTDSLSGGESQRLKMIKYIGKRLANKIFIFDEPLQGLSNINISDIFTIFEDLTKSGATVVFIEHNVAGFKVLDYVIEMGPGKGKYGGKITFSGWIDNFLKTDRAAIYRLSAKDS